MSIDSLYENAIAELTIKEKIVIISKKLLSLTTNGERVLYVYELLEELKSFPTALQVNKTDKVSIYYRNLGNQRFQNKKDYQAWQYYNLSLLHAPYKSENYCLALANRSAVFFSLRKFKECLQDLIEVFSLNYPKKLKNKLNKRQLLCKENLAKKHVKDQFEAEIEALLKLEGTGDPRFPCAGSKLEVVFSKEMGRHVIAKEDIRVGEVLVKENPYFTLLLKSQYLFSCSYCLSRNLNLYPCDVCCFALYCSAECKEKAWKDYHSIECTLMPTLVHMQFTKLELLALRTVIKARSDHSDWDSLFKTIDEAEANMDTEYRGHVKVDNQWVYDSKYYSSIHTLASNIEKRSVSDIFQKSVSAAVFLHLLKQETDFCNAVDKNLREKIENYVAGTLLLHIMTSPTNMHGLSTNMQTAQGDYTEEISLASAPYAFHSLLNHSCSPNVVRFSKLGAGEMTLFALRPIKKGMQLFDNYGAHHAIEGRNSRRESLRSQYKFTCLCEACFDNWPTYHALKSARGLPVAVARERRRLLSSETIEDLQKGDKGTALKIFKPLCALAEELEPYAPCIEFADCQETIKQCLAIFEGMIPYGYSDSVEWNALPPKVT